DEVQIQSVDRSHSGLDFFFNAVPGGHYELESSSNLMTWTALYGILGDNFESAFHVDFAGQTSHFFRVKRVPEPSIHRAVASRGFGSKPRMIVTPTGGSAAGAAVRQSGPTKIPVD